jgi:DNA-binding response OmpR family regulator
MATTFSAILTLGAPLANLSARVLDQLGFTSTRMTDPTELSRRVASSPQLVLCDLDRETHLVDRVLAGRSSRVAVIGFTRVRSAGVKLDAFAREIDDVVQLPLDPAELIVRTYAVMYRVHGVRTPLVETIAINGVEMSLRTEQVIVNGKVLRLTPSEKAVLLILAANPARSLTADEIHSVMWDDVTALDGNVVARHVHAIRAKLADPWRTPEVIETIARGGYRYRLPAAAREPLST